MRRCSQLTALSAIILAVMASQAAAQVCPTIVITSFPFSENFDNFGATPGSTVPPANWAQDPLDGGGVGGATDWIFQNGALPGGPSAHHSASAGYYAHVDDTGGSHAAINLVLPCMSFSLTVNPTLQFWVHSNNTNPNPTGSTQNFLHIDAILHPVGIPLMDLAPPIGHLGPGWNLVTVDLGAVAGAGAFIQIVFRGDTDGSSGGHDIAIDDIVVTDGPAYDFATTSLDSPTSSTCALLSSSETVQVTLQNNGTVAIDPGFPVQVSYSIDGGTPVEEIATFGSPVMPGATVQYTFTTTADLSAGGFRSITAGSAESDPTPADDTVTANIFAGLPSPVTSYPFSENFDGFGATNGSTAAPPCWSQSASDGGGTGPDTDWIFGNTVPASGNGPTGDHTTGSGFFAYTNAQNGSHPSIVLTMPSLNLSGLTNPNLSFWMWSDNPMGTQNTLSVDVIDIFGGMTFTDVVGPIQSSGPMWVQQNVDLSPFAGATILLEFRSRTDGSALHNVAIDDILIDNSGSPSGQSPQAGRASMDINNSQNVNGDSVMPGRPGPFFETVQVGGAFTFTFEGQPLQPVIVLAGPLNVGVLNIPGIGQLDIGGPINPMNGLPTGLGVLADGNIPSGFNIFFNTGPTGTLVLAFQTPPLPPGIIGTFQAAIYNSVTLIAFSNAVQVSI